MPELYEKRRSFAQISEVVGITAKAACVRLVQRRERMPLTTTLRTKPANLFGLSATKVEFRQYG